MNKYINILKYGIVFLAALNLIFLFAFGYTLPIGLSNKLSTNNHLADNLYADQTYHDTTTNTVLSFKFETEALQYDGSVSLNLLSGVSLLDKDGNPVELDIYSTVEATDNSNIKTIIYSAKDSEGNEAIAKRKLTLNNYYGPKLSIGQPYPKIFDVELDYILDTFLDNNLLNANDGYNKDITNAIQCTYEITDTNAQTSNITFTVTNHFNDTVTKTVTIPISRTKPMIILNETSVTIKAGDNFDPLSFVASATNEEGKDLKSLIEITGDINPTAAGTYTITYTLADVDQEQAEPVALKVVVEK